MPIAPKAKPNIWKAKTASKRGQWSSTNDSRYHLPKWRSLRKQQLTKQPLCVYCERKGLITKATIADHIKAVRLGGEFWDINNLQSLCVNCHNAKRD